jgi:hypothetical protein
MKQKDVLKTQNARVKLENDFLTQKMEEVSSLSE